MAYLSAAYECTITKERVAVYWHQLGNLPDSAFSEAVVAHVNANRSFPRVCELRELAQAVIRRTGPKVLEPPRVSTEAVLRGHARILGVNEEEYISEMLKRD
ncbi:hypothetical protein AB833_14040 [Chromatiales bacterium (ex Bugula neritina AB1)]|nr:hypothetical protein AB833_14040 [Chromatiales bacterium (ex Bugula neritina AB1)]